MRIVVIGGTGLIGSRLAPHLVAAGHEVVLAAPSTGVDVLTGAGVDEALTGTDVVVDVSNSPSFEDAAVLDFFTRAGRTLAAAEARAGVRHHVALSIVGAERSPDSGYLRAKVAQEEIVRTSGTPYSILRATQFFEFLRSIANASTLGDEVRVTDATLQPVAADEVASTLAEVTLGEPIGDHVELGGPERHGLDVLVRRVLEADGDARRTVADHAVGYFGAVIDDASLTTAPGARLGTTTLETWLRTNVAVR
ncbi:SDR family oxidoreductase [Cellulomonas sp. NPDC055163]